MKHRPKFQQEKEQSATQQHQTHEQTAREFATVEELLRADEAQTDVPPAIAQRLTKSIDQLPKPPPSNWWQRLFGR